MSKENWENLRDNVHDEIRCAYEKSKLNRGIYTEPKILMGKLIGSNNSDYIFKVLYRLNFVLSISPLAQLTKIRVKKAKNIFVVLSMLQSVKKYESHLKNLQQSEYKIQSLNKLKESLSFVQQNFSLLTILESSTLCEYDILYKENSLNKQGTHLYQLNDGRCVHQVKVSKLFNDIQQAINAEKFMCEQDRMYLDDILVQKHQTQSQCDGLKPLDRIRARFIVNSLFWLNNSQIPYGAYPLTSSLLNAVWAADCDAEMVKQSLRNEIKELPNKRPLWIELSSLTK